MGRLKATRGNFLINGMLRMLQATWQAKKKKKEITEDAFIKNMSALSSVQVLRNKAVECCDYGIAALIEEDDEKMSLLKKSWRDNFREIYDEKFQKECLRELQERPVTAETTMLTYNYDQTL